jgi:hypothetical protein
MLVFCATRTKAPMKENVVRGVKGGIGRGVMAMLQIKI